MTLLLYTYTQGECVADLMLGSQACSTVEEYRRNMADLVTQGLSRLNHIQNVGQRNYALPPCTIIARVTFELKL